MVARWVIYRVTAQPGLGWGRAYVGACHIRTWGTTAEEAAAARAGDHFAHGATSAAWLRPCAEEGTSSNMACSVEEAYALSDHALKYDVLTRRNICPE